MWVEVDVEGQGASFTSQPFLCDNSCHFLYLSGNRVVGAKCKAKLLASQNPPFTQPASLVPGYLTVRGPHLPGQPGMGIRSQDPDIPRKNGC